MPTPAWLPTRRTLAPNRPRDMRIWSNRPVMNTRTSRRTAPCPTAPVRRRRRSCSPPRCPSGRSAPGTSWRTCFDRVLSDRSASSTTSSGWVSPRRTSASPKASRDATAPDASCLTGALTIATPSCLALAARSSRDRGLELRRRRRHAVPANFPSMNDTPLPLMVSARMNVGLPLVGLASASAAAIWRVVVAVDRESRSS